MLRRKNPWLARPMFAFYLGAIMWSAVLVPRSHAATSHDLYWDIRLCEPVGDGIRWLGGKVQDWWGGLFD